MGGIVRTQLPKPRQRYRTLTQLHQCNFVVLKNGARTAKAPSVGYLSGRTLTGWSVFAPPRELSRVGGVGGLNKFEGNLTLCSSFEGIPYAKVR
jgi:hypothetical protein